MRNQSSREDRRKFHAVLALASILVASAGSLGCDQSLGAEPPNTDSISILAADDPFEVLTDESVVAVAQDCLSSPDTRPVSNTAYGYLTCGVAPSGAQYLLVGTTTDAAGHVNGGGAVVVNLGGPAEPPLGAVFSWLATQTEAFRDEHPMIAFVAGPPSDPAARQKIESCQVALQRLLQTSDSEQFLNSLPSCDYNATGNDFTTVRDDVVWLNEKYTLAGFAGYSYGASLFLAIAQDAFVDDVSVRLYADSPKRFMDDWRDRTDHRIGALEAMWGDFQNYCREWTGRGSRIKTENQTRRVDCDWTFEAALQGLDVAERVLVARNLYESHGSGEYLDTYGLLGSRQARSQSIEAEGVARTGDTERYWSAVCTLNASNPDTVDDVRNYLDEIGAEAPTVAELAIYLEVGGCVGATSLQPRSSVASDVTALIVGNRDDPLLGIDGSLQEAFPNARIELLAGDTHLLISRSFDCNAAAVDAFFAGAADIDKASC